MKTTDLQMLRHRLKLEQNDLNRFENEQPHNQFSISTTKRNIEIIEAKLALFPES